MSGGALYRARAGLRLIRMMRLVYRAGLTQHALRVLVNGRMHIRAHMGPVPVLVLGWLGSMVATVGIVIMMVVGTPRCRSPIRYIATGIQQVDGENRRARYGITIYRSSVGITVYGEAVCIVAGSCPGYGRVVAIRAVGNRTVAVRVYLAGGKQESCRCEKRKFEVFVFQHFTECLRFYHLLFYELQAVFVNSLEAVISSSNLDVCLL